MFFSPVDPKVSSVQYLTVRKMLGGFSNGDRDGRENVTIKMNSQFFLKVIVIIPSRFKFAFS